MHLAQVPNCARSCGTDKHAKLVIILKCVRLLCQPSPNLQLACTKVIRSGPQYIDSNSDWVFQQHLKSKSGLSARTHLCPCDRVDALTPDICSRLGQARSGLTRFAAPVSTSGMQLGKPQVACTASIMPESHAKHPLQPDPLFNLGAKLCLQWGLLWL